ncbi:MAG: ATP-binding protein [Eubacteriales bacterium]
MADLNRLHIKLQSLSVFHSLLNDPLFHALSNVLDTSDKSQAEQVSGYSALAALLFMENGDLAESMLQRVLEDENAYVLKKAHKQEISRELEVCLKNELAILEELSQIQSRDVRDCLGWDGPLPDWTNSPVQIDNAFGQRMETIATEGYGIFRKTHMFHVEDGRIVPVSLPDPISLTELKGYERERNSVIQNTLFLLKEKPAANVLLYGDAGTGKSSTVKAIANEYRHKGLRLIEINKKQFGEIPQLYKQLADNHLKFILFIDDLSFDQNNDDFKALKAILEGSASAKAPNIAVYATSNRRHLVKESFSDRNGDDIHVNETIQELTSLSERFGLQVHFYQPDRDLYLRIVRSLAKQLGQNADNTDLDLEAERYALMRGGRSPRVARQFIDFYLNTQE